ncbi:sulfoxide reductase heme-binding subunit YedZ [[Haemophilus] felis]|uniref:Protein-methionine-sulfoxide reductase heme-binding subunit MsrQ n=1 Tax=[Haemophilus] felis TaxID=123822 RepID=A0A1T0AXC0_9PAST|nr:sulfoxide reductase heme-binding subunit YedZ [[Haemophilus] felis]OOS02545.1 sulfoxide reductase heme-binding subunit YedZ [[Haemophilus] felis]
MLNIYRLFIHSLCAAPLIWLAWVLSSGDASQLGADPIKELIHFLGFGAISILITMFILGIVLFLLKQPQLQILRRPLGLWSWIYVSLHICTYLVLELGLEFSLFFNELLQRNYLIIGVFSFFILSLMALSSLPKLKQIMGKYWHYLHKFGYLALLLGAIHYYWAVKNITLGSVLYLSLSIFVMVWELRRLLRYRKG